jgi:tetratricopeptide (TPR) repeat protein
MRIGTRTLASTLVAVGVCLAASSAHAQEPREQARALFEEASRQFEAGNHQLALQGFVRSRELMADDPRASALLLFNIARAQEELNRLEEALATFREYLVSSPADAPFREETQDRVRELQARIDAAGGGGGGGDGGGDPSGPVAAPPSSSPLPLVGGIVLGVGAAVVLGSIVPGVMALDGASQLEAACPGGSCPPEEAGRIDDTHTLGIVTDVLWVSGAVLAAAGAALLVVGIASEGSSDSAATPSVRPVAGCSLDGCFGGVTGRY